MQNAFSILFGVIAGLLTFGVELVALFPPALTVYLFFPALGALTMLGLSPWIGVLLALIGVIVGWFSKRRSGLIFCLVVLAIAAVRLMLGGRLF